MKAICTHSPTTVSALDARDPDAGGARHVYAIQYGADRCVIQFQHGPRGEDGSTPGVFEDDLLAILEDRISAFQEGRFACKENEATLAMISAARKSLQMRSTERMARNVLGKNEE